MPYIDQEARERIEDTGHLYTPGELNYAITKLLLHYASQHLDGYTTYNDILGALEGAKLEFYRRRVVPYEQLKAVQNGDLYD
jgi:hypothetical protein